MKNNKQNFQTKIGLEIHLRLQTEKKLFSGSLNQISTTPNRNINSYDLGYPGTLPQLNLEALKLAIQTCSLLHFELDHTLYFDRKNYYYFDLPKGYQITQFYRPLGKNGYLFLQLPNSKPKKIHLVSAHLEEDTAKIIHQDQQLLADYNRSGMPLMEIVTEPDFTNFTEIELFLKSLIWTLSVANISEMKFEEGSIRVDVNISQQLGETCCPLTEIKNLNSLKNIEKAIVQETIDQRQHFSSLKKSCTKTFDENTNSLVTMRQKFSQSRYFFMRENNIAPIRLSANQQQKDAQHLLWLQDFDIKFCQHYPQLNSQEKDFIFSNLAYLFYFRLLTHYFTDNYQLILLFLKQVVQPLFALFGQKSKKDFCLSQRHCNQNLVNFLVQKSHQKEFDFILQTDLENWEKNLFKRLNFYWSDFNQSNHHKLAQELYDSVLKQRLFLDLDLTIALLNLYQKKQINFKAVKEIIFSFYNQKISYNLELVNLVIDFLNEKAIDENALILIRNILKQFLEDDLQLRANYFQFPEKTTNYLMGQIYRQIKTKLKVDVKIHPQTVKDTIQTFFENLNGKKN